MPSLRFFFMKSYPWLAIDVKLSYVSIPIYFYLRAEVHFFGLIGKQMKTDHMLILWIVNLLINMNNMSNYRHYNANLNSCSRTKCKLKFSSAIRPNTGFTYSTVIWLDLFIAIKIFVQYDEVFSRNNDVERWKFYLLSEIPELKMSFCPDNMVTMVMYLHCSNRVMVPVLYANLKLTWKSYIPLETAAIFFSSEPFSLTGY